MDNPFAFLWLVPILPLLAAGMIALLPRSRANTAAELAIGAQALSFAVSVMLFLHTVQTPGRKFLNFTWLQTGEFSLPLGLLLDPLTGAMLVMVTFVSLLIFVFSLGYMSLDPNLARFFCFLSLFSAGMLGIVVSNSLLLLFAAWEVVGLASYLLIGFWFERPAAADAARKAFLTTRVGDIGLLLGMLWLYNQSGTLLFYNGGRGCLEAGALVGMSQAIVLGLPVGALIALLIFCGAAGKSGQFPLHVWLPDAMEGPTPVSALIHAATMVAAGVFLVARVFPLFEIVGQGGGGAFALQVVVWIGSITAFCASLVALAQFDIKRILAYSTVSQLGLMMVALGVGGWAAGVAHLIAHAFFKALLFLGAGAVIHGTHHTQDIRALGGLRRAMPVTFAVYAIGMMALAGFPLLFCGFWTKEAVLHAVHAWPYSQVPFYFAAGGALLTAFYMTRQTLLVFFGKWRGPGDAHHAPHERPPVMLLPMLLLAVCVVLLSLIFTPAWPWFAAYVSGVPAAFEPGALLAHGSLGLFGLSVGLVTAGVFAGWFLYGRRAPASAEALDPLERIAPFPFRVLNRAFYIDALYQAVFVRGLDALGALAVAFDRFFASGVVALTAALGRLAAWFSDAADRIYFNDGFEDLCARLSGTGGRLARTSTGRIASNLRAFGLALVVLLVVYAWTL
jgi:NADH-quinone oxidoreductase subunit L